MDFKHSATSFWQILLHPGGSCFLVCAFPFYYLSFVSALFLSFVFSFVNASFLCLCFLFFDGLGLKDSPSSNMLRSFQNIPRCSSFFGCCSSLGFGDEVNSQFLTAIATNIVQISRITNKLAFSPTIDLLTNGGQRHLSEVDI